MVLGTTATRLDVTKAEVSGVQRILDAADRAAPAIRTKIQDALTSLIGQAGDLEAIIASGDIAGVFSALDQIGVPKVVLDAVIDATAEVALTSGMPEAARFGISFNEAEVQSIRWAKMNAAENISGLKTASQEVVRQIIEEAVTRGLSVRHTAKQIERVVPLLPRHAESINRQWAKMLEDGMDPEYVGKVLGRKSKKLLRYRADMIARTESLRASNMGQQIAWTSALDSGYLPEGTAKKWMATEDDRTCPICILMDEKIIDIRGDFRVSEKATGISNGVATGTKPIKRPSTTKTPPAHPNCRCTVVLEDLPAEYVRRRDQVITGPVEEPLDRMKRQFAEEQAKRSKRLAQPLEKPSEWRGWSNEQRTEWLEDRMEGDWPLDSPKNLDPDMWNLDRKDDLLAAQTIFDYSGMDGDLMFDISNTYRELGTSFPEVGERLKYIGGYKGERLSLADNMPKGRVGSNLSFGRVDWGVGDRVYAHASTNGQRIGMNPAWFSDPEKLRSQLKWDAASGFHPPTSVNPSSIVTHEYGHQVDNWITREAKDAFSVDGSPALFAPGARIDGTGFVSAMHSESLRPVIANPVSKYGEESRAEAFAEAFEAWYDAPKVGPRKMLDVRGYPDDVGAGLVDFDVSMRIVDDVYRGKIDLYSYTDYGDFTHLSADEKTAWWVIHDATIERWNPYA